MMRTKTPERESRNPHALLEFLARYLVMPRPQKAKGKRQGGLEQQLGQEKPRPSSVLEEIQQSIDSIISGSPFQEELSITQKISKEAASSLTYSFSRKTTAKKSYSVSIRYRSTDQEEQVDVTITSDEESSSETTITRTAKKKEAKHYAFSIHRLRHKEEQRGYELRLAYDYSNNQERATLEYIEKAYAKQFHEQREDFTNRVQLKTLHLKPKNIMGGILGYTYLGESFMARRDDLTGSTARMVDIHESIHTPDEYETRVLTDWIMEKPKMNSMNHAKIDTTRYAKIDPMRYMK